MNELTEKISIGDVIRSFDFPKYYREIEGENASFFEGIVLEENVDPFLKKGPYFLIKVTKRVWGGENVAFDDELKQYCPMPHAVGSNGKLLNGITLLTKKEEL